MEVEEKLTANFSLGDGQYQHFLVVCKGVVTSHTFTQSHTAPLFFRLSRVKMTPYHSRAHPMYVSLMLWGPTSWFLQV